MVFITSSDPLLQEEIPVSVVGGLSTLRNIKISNESIGYRRNVFAATLPLLYSDPWMYILSQLNNSQAYPSHLLNKLFFSREKEL